MEKLKMHSPDLTRQNIARIRELFPGCVTEARGKDGDVRLSVDFDLLRQELSDSIVEGPQERYHLDWPGKREALLTANAPIAKTLRPCREESVDFDTTKNLFIEGDNLDALKLLQETYLGKVKLIYIDPPYNTGNDFIFEDDFAENTEEFLRRSNQQDDEGNRMIANKDSNGRFHSDWLSMMYARLKIARNFLSEDGVIFISIDDVEVANLKELCSEVFGEHNFIATLIWEKGRKNDAKLISVGHDYMLVFVKDKATLRERKTKWREIKPGAKEILQEYIKLRRRLGNDNKAVEEGIRYFYDSIPRTHPSKKHSRYNKVDDNGIWRDDNMSWPGGGGPMYEVIHPETKIACAIPEGGWRYSTPERMEEMIRLGKVVFRKDHTEPPIKKTYLVELDEESNSEDDAVSEGENDSEDVPIQVAGSYFYRSALQASNELNQLFGNKVFTNPKDKEVIARWISYVNVSDGDIVMDFFAGSGTTGHAVIELNALEGKNIRYILVQIPEEINPKTKGAIPAVSFLEKLNRPCVVSELTKERLRRSGQKYLHRGSSDNWNRDIGFRVLKVDSSNMADVYYAPDGLQQANLSFYENNIKHDRTHEDLLFQVMLDWGVDLTLPIRKETVRGKTVFLVDENAILACFDDAIDEELVKELTKFKPLRAVFRDSGYISDSVKINAEQIFKQMSPGTEVKSL